MGYRIGYIATDEEEVQLLKEEVFPSEVAQGELLIEVVQPQYIRSVAKRLIQRGAQAIIARGGNFQDVHNVISDVPLIELEIMTQDVFAVLGEVVDRYEEIWLVLSSYAKFDYDACRSLLPDKVHYFHYGPVEDMQAFLAGLDAPRNTIIIGGGFVVGPASARGFDAIRIHSSPASLRESYTSAQTILRERDKEAARSQQIATILFNIEDGVVVLDNKGRVTLCNRKAGELLETSPEAIQGNRLTTLFPDFLPVEEAGRRGKTMEQLIKTQAYTLTVKVSPITEISKNIPAGGVLLTLRDVTKLQELEKNLRFQLSKKGLTARYHFEDILTCEKSMKALIQWGRECAQSDSTVMIYGESGTGKELFAQSIHNASPRQGYPFVAVNCAALTENLLESELFGYVSGAFTGARKEGKAGLFELAHRGTIFLDEVNSMSLQTQAKILRVIEQREVMRIGSDYIIPLDVRIITAANENLVQMVRQNTFRRDLFFRLNVLEIRIPPLNQRPKDILYLFRNFVAQLSGGSAQEMALSPELEQTLVSHNWWGNVRELRNAAQRYAAYRTGGVDSQAILPELSDNGDASLVDSDLRVDLKELSRTVEGLVIQSLLNRGLTKTQTAKALGISRTALFKKMEGHKEADQEKI